MFSPSTPPPCATRSRPLGRRKVTISEVSPPEEGTRRQDLESSGAKPGFLFQLPSGGLQHRFTIDSLFVADEAGGPLNHLGLNRLPVLLDQHGFLLGSNRHENDDVGDALAFDELPVLSPAQLQVPARA